MVACVIATPSLALAQVAPPAVPPAASGLPTREQLESGAPPVRTTLPAPSRLHVQDSIESAPCALDNPGYAAIHVHITQAVFANLGPVSAGALDDTWRGMVGTDQPISVLCRIRDAAATRLRAMGYLAAVEVPVQRIVDGQIRFEVLYARISSVRVIGHPGRNRGLLQAYLNALADGHIFNRFSAERQILLARDIPGYEIYLTLKPSGSGAGRMIAEVRVESTPLVIDGTVSDLAAPATGRIGGQLRATINGLTGLGDQTTLSAYTTSQFHKQQIWQIGHQAQLGASGLQVAAHVTYAVTRPALSTGLPPIDAHTLLIDLAASYPLLRHETGSLKLSGGIDVINQNVKFADLLLSRDRLRVGFLKLDGETHDSRGPTPWGVPLWRVSSSVELRRGLAILGSTPDCLAASSPCLPAGFVPPSIPVANPQATVVRASADIEVNPVRAFSVDVGLRGQLASSSVYAFEQFALGNYSVGRGYAPGALVGDQGLAVSADLRSPLLVVSRHSAIAVQPFVFSDNGWTAYRLANNHLPAHLHSLGGGLRTNLGSLAQLDTSLAVPLTRLASSPKMPPPLFLLTLSTRFWPWRYR